LSGVDRAAEPIEATISGSWKTEFRQMPAAVTAKIWSEGNS
jgi:hypothetical protein